MLLQMSTEPNVANRKIAKICEPLFGYFSTLFSNIELGKLRLLMRFKEFSQMWQVENSIRNRAIWRSIGVVLFLFVLTLLSVGCQSTYEFKGTVLDPPKPLADFELQTTTGESFHLSDTAGDFTLVYFGYTFCPDVCPLTLADIRKALAKLDEVDRARVHVVFISVDPERDTPEALARYLSAFDPTFIGLTDDYAKIETVMDDFGAFAQKDDTTESAAGYLVGHTSNIFLINPNNELSVLYSFGFVPEDLQSDLEYLLAQEGT